VFPDGDGPSVDVTAPLELPERSLVCLVAKPADPGDLPPGPPDR